ncbi:glycoside hydrolase family 15 protein [Amnibacterium endophyticum]|uniref:Glycoside hydrolase family 15 protein n=1 Tax=Amnibacterium endophyticum TaxID=2109337 RepID=A0ABW4LG54_9MICO
MTGGEARFPLHTLREYALIADGERGALIGPNGDVPWLCVPRWDSDAVFSALIGGGGTFAIVPRAGTFTWGGHYERGSLIWRSRWIDHHAVIESRDALAFPGEQDRAVVLRRIEAHRGTARVRVVLDPRESFGSGRFTHVRHDGDVWTGRCGDLSVRLTGLDEVSDRDGVLAWEVDVPEGEFHDVVLELSRRALPDERPSAEGLWRRTEEAWSAAVPERIESIAPADARHAYAVLRGLTSSSGAMVAAATMSLPERAEQGRNYDYRYAWIRDQCYAGQAAGAGEALPLLDDAVRFVGARLLEDGPHLKPAYTTDGGRVPDQRHLDLPGYPGGDDVLGNHVNAQFQLDALGESLLLFATAARHGRLTDDGRRAAEVAADAIRQRRGDEDAGIWELSPKRWTHSALACVAGLRAMAPHADRGTAARWTDLADSMVSEASRTMLEPSGRWRRAADDPGLDAALLLGQVRGALPADDPRSVATRTAVLEDLAQEEFMYRFRPDERPLGEAEGAFLLCGFITSLALHQADERVAAARWFERNRAACGPPGIISEEYDVAQRQLRGNLPQAFVHALLLESAIRLAD